MKKVNCWEYSRCGRGFGGDRVSKDGLCPAATAENLDGKNHGYNGGRACWAVEGACHGQSVEKRFKNCMFCPFFLRVQNEEGRDFCVMSELLGEKNPKPAECPDAIVQADSL